MEEKIRETLINLNSALDRLISLETESLSYPLKKRISSHTFPAIKRSNLKRKQVISVY